VSVVIETIPVGALATNCHLVGDPDSRKAFIVDPGAEPETILSKVSEGKWAIDYITITHAHFDHVMAAGQLVNELKAPFLVPPKDLPVLARANESSTNWFGDPGDPIPPHDGTLEEGDTVSAGSFTFTVAETPGHSPGGICLIGDGCAFVGDTIFAGSVGRTDFPGGDFPTLMKSIREKILVLDDGVVLHTGHGPATTVGEERRTNPFILQMDELLDLPGGTI
jgi:glyoxylase-like metal-dependent hydrolase (beta-lactamase superfamily II)